MRLLENRHPIDDTKLSPRNRDNRRKGWDVNFNTPKSVGIAFGLNNDFEIDQGNARPTKHAVAVEVRVAATVSFQIRRRRL